MKSILKKYILLAFFELLLFYLSPQSNAYTFCGYGETYDYLSDSCKCSYGYVRSYTGCITDDQYCRNKYGIGAQADFAGNCECTYGYVLSGGQCILTSTYCNNKYGLHSSYNTLSKKCECSSGYTPNNVGNKCISADEKCKEDYGWNAESDSIIVNKFSNLECVCKSGYMWNALKTSCTEGNTRCHEILGFSSKYNLLSDKCECNFGYILSNNKCISESEFCENSLGQNSHYIGNNTCDCDAGFLINNNECITEDAFCEIKLGQDSHYIGNGACECDDGFVYIEDSIECKSEEDFCLEKLGENSGYIGDLECECDDGFVLDNNNNQCLDEEQFCETYFGENMEYSGGNECECASGYHESDNGCSKNFLSLPISISTKNNKANIMIIVVILLIVGASITSYINKKPKV